MQKPIFAALFCAALAGSARADVTWEHTAQVSLGTGTPVVTMNLRNDWSGQNHRARLSFDASAMGAGAQGRGTVDVIERLGDDRLVLSLRNPTNTGAAFYVDEPYTTLQERLRINFFEAFDPQFAAHAEPVPALTDEQRKRLGQELRAYIKPFQQQFSRQYFRALDEKRTINGLECRGYRYTSITLVPKKVAGSDQSVRMESEFWIASNQPGDDEIASFTTAANKLKSGPQTVSMWLNEAFPILAEAMPDETQNAIAALIGRKGEANYGFRGTPVQFFVTVKLPPDGAPMPGMDSIRFAANLTRHSNDPIPARAFASPIDGTHIELQPFLDVVKNGLKQARQKLQQGMGSML